MTDITVTKVDETYAKVTCADDGLQMELHEFFVFYAPKYQFSPAYKKGRWDGTLKLLDGRNGKIYNGLIPYIKAFAKERGYKVRLVGYTKPQKISPEDIVELEKILEPTDENGERIHMRPYQLNAVYTCVKNHRRIILSPTGSGKSLVIYTLARLYSSLSDEQTGKVLVVVPTTGLVNQLYSDFEQYSKKNGWNAAKHVHMIYSGQEKLDKNKSVFISTWQSIYDLPKEYFETFDTVIFDEVHLAEANCTKGIMEKCSRARVRIGLTGTVRDAKTHKLVLEGLFGKIQRVENTRDMMDRGELAELDINFVYLSYPKDERKQLARLIGCEEKATKKYKAEIDFLCAHHKRSLFIKNLSLSLKGNTLVLFNYVENHGEILRSLIERDAHADRKVFFVYGGTSGEQRNKIRSIVEKERDAIIIASFGTFSTGINIKNIHNIIFASPSKSKIRVLQSIGRGLRKSSSKKKVSLFDIVDDLCVGEWKNYALRHADDRREIYDRERFFYTINKVQF